MQTPATLPAAPDTVENLLWAALFILVPALCTAVVVLWKLNQKLRDQREQDLKERVIEERREKEENQKTLQALSGTLSNIEVALKRRSTK